jgi:hypothetical protein
MAKLCEAPFIKVEATKYTEVGFHGKDVDQIIRDLVDVAMAMTKKRMKEVCCLYLPSCFQHRDSSLWCIAPFEQQVKEAAVAAAEERILSALVCK